MIYFREKAFTHRLILYIIADHYRRETSINPVKSRGYTSTFINKFLTKNRKPFIYLLNHKLSIHLLQILNHRQNSDCCTSNLLVATFKFNVIIGISLLDVFPVLHDILEKM